MEKTFTITLTSEELANCISGLRYVKRNSMGDFSKEFVESNTKTLDAIQRQLGPAIDILKDEILPQ